MSRTIPFAQFLFSRLRQLNCHSVHGVPGDFFLRALDHLPASNVKWIGNANELCAGYAADGYSRARNQLLRRKDVEGRSTNRAMLGALMTTYGAGELSAINAIAGSYSESIPVAHIVGTPIRQAMRNGDPRRPIHHTLTDGRMDVYAEMTKAVTCGQALLHLKDDAIAAAEAFDEVLGKAVRHSKPVYVTLPSDMVELPLSAGILERPLSLTIPKSGSKALESVVELVLKKIRASKSPLIVADGLSYPFDLQSEINKVVALTHIPSMSFTSGKGVIDESLPFWSAAMPNSTEYSQNSDLVLFFGPLLSDTNTARWSGIPRTQNTILFNLDSIEIDGQAYKGIRSKDVLQHVIPKIEKEKLVYQKDSDTQVSDSHRETQSTPSGSGHISQDDFWQAMSDFLQPEDTLLLANGTPLIGGRQLRLSSPCQVVASSVWCSIGQMLPAAQGIAAAKRDHNLPGRTILFEGDGSLQVTCQSISDIIRYKLDVTIFIVNNAGYTYERWLNGMEAEYNDVPSWRYIDAPSFFGTPSSDSDYPVFTRRVETWAELQDVLADERTNDGKGLKIVDVVMDPKDVPENSKAGLKRASEALRSA